MTANAIGRMRHRLTIEAPLRVDDDGGGATITWATVATVWAQVTARSGRETTRADMPTARATYRVVMRYRADVDPTMRLVWADRILEVLSVRDEDGTRVWLTCDCEERGP